MKSAGEIGANMGTYELCRIWIYEGCLCRTASTHASCHSACRNREAQTMPLHKAHATDVLRKAHLGAGGGISLTDRPCL